MRGQQVVGVAVAVVVVAGRAGLLLGFALLFDSSRSPFRVTVCVGVGVHALGSAAIAVAIAIAVRKIVGAVRRVEAAKGAVTVIVKGGRAVLRFTGC